GARAAGGPRAPPSPAGADRAARLRRPRRRAAEHDVLAALLVAIAVVPLGIRRHRRGPRVIPRLDGIPLLEVVTARACAGLVVRGVAHALVDDRRAHPAPPTRRARASGSRRRRRAAIRCRSHASTSTSRSARRAL